MAKKQLVSADALDDDQFELDEDLVGSSFAAAGPSGSSVIGSDDGEDVGTAGTALKLSEQKASGGGKVDAGKTKKGKKRKQEPVESGEVPPGAAEGGKAKRRKTEGQGALQDNGKKSQQQKKAKEKQEKAEKAKKGRSLQPATEAPQEDVSIGLQPPDLQHLYLSDKQKRALKGISDLELAALRIPEAWLADVMGLEKRGNLGAWLAEAHLPGLVDAVKEPTDAKGSPTVLVVAGAALRVADLCREVKPLVPSPSESGDVAKLFARHFKLSEHASQLRDNRYSIAVGTPDRLSKLLESGALSTSRLRWVVLDVTWTDAKKYSLLELPDVGVREALWKGILGHDGLRSRLAMAGARIVLF